MTSTRLTEDEVVERNLRVIDEHFHNENQVEIDKAIALYAPEIVWELPARGVLYRDKAQVKQATPPVPEQAVETTKEDARWVKTKAQSARR